MGACEVSTVRSGESARKVFNIICDEDEREYGSDSYNGSFSTCSLTRVHNLFDNTKRGTRKKRLNFWKNGILTNGMWKPLIWV